MADGTDRAVLAPGASGPAVERLGRLGGTLDLSHPRRVHVTNVGGAGMSAVATLLAESHHRVSGHDPAATTPFLFFTDHHDELGRAVTEGRRTEFSDFEGFGGTVPDPQDPDTFERSRLDWDRRRQALTLVFPGITNVRLQGGANYSRSLKRTVLSLVQRTGTATAAGTAAISAASEAANVFLEEERR